MTKRIPVTPHYFALVDDEDFEFLTGFSWHVVITAKGKVYARGRVNGKRQYLHQLLTGYTRTRPHQRQRT